MAEPGVKYLCKGPRVADSDPMADERVPCGADLTKLILAVTQDGETHDVECPTCGNTTSVRRTRPA